MKVPRIVRVIRVEFKNFVGVIEAIVQEDEEIAVLPVSCRQCQKGQKTNNQIVQRRKSHGSAFPVGKGIRYCEENFDLGIPRSSYLPRVLSSKVPAYIQVLSRKVLFRAGTGNPGCMWKRHIERRCEVHVALQLLCMQRMEKEAVAGRAQVQLVLNDTQSLILVVDDLVAFFQASRPSYH
jgi:hypothetical protein